MAGITSTKKIKGQPHLLAYITPNEVKKLKALGGQETMTAEGIPAYPEYDNYGFSSQADFDAGDVSKSNDPNVRGEGKNLDGSKQNRITAAELANINAKEKALADIKSGFVGQSKVNPSFFEIGGKKDRHNKRARQKFIKYLIKEKQKNLQMGLMDPSVPGIDAMTFEDMISFVPTVKDYVDKGDGKGLYSKDSAYAKGEKIPSYNINPDLPGILSFAADKFSGPVTQDKLQEYYNQINTLENLDPNDPKNSIQNLMKIYQPNRFNLGNDKNPSNRYQLYPFPPEEIDEVVETTPEKTFEYRFGNNQNVGADVTRGFYNQGGRIPRAFGGIMDSATGRKAYGLGSIFKSIGKAAKKVLSSDIGKAAIAGAAFYYGGGGKFGPGGMKGFSPRNFFSKSNPLLYSNKEFNPLKMAGLITLGGALAGPAKQDSLEGFNNRGGRLIDPITGEEGTPASMRASLNDALDNADGDPDKIKAITNAYSFLGPDERLGTYLPYQTYGVKDGGLIRSRFALGGQPLPADPTKPINPFAPKPTGPVLPNKNMMAEFDIKEYMQEFERVFPDMIEKRGTREYMDMLEDYFRGLASKPRDRGMAQEGGLMDLGGMEKDYRNEGGFVPIGREEKADDVPARLSVNEFVFTADAVRNAGGGDIDKGAEVMENMMKNLENGGRVSEESQGNTGAQEMFSVSERIGEVI